MERVKIACAHREPQRYSRLAWSQRAILNLRIVIPGCIAVGQRAGHLGMFHSRQCAQPFQALAIPGSPVLRCVVARCRQVHIEC